MISAGKRAKTNLNFNTKHLTKTIQRSVIPIAIGSGKNKSDLYYKISYLEKICDPDSNRERENSKDNLKFWSLSLNRT